MEKDKITANKFQLPRYSKKCTTPSNEFLLHKCRNNRKMKIMDFFFLKICKKYTSPANQFLLQKCRNNS